MFFNRNVEMPQRPPPIDLFVDNLETRIAPVEWEEFDSTLERWILVHSRSLAI